MVTASAKIEFIKRKIAEAIENAKNKVNDAKNLGIDTANVEKLLAEAETAFDTGKLEVAIKTAKQAESLAIKLAEEVFIQGASITFATLKRKVAKLQKFGADTTELETLINRAKTKFSEGNYSESYKLATEAEKLVKDIEQNIVSKVDLPDKIAKFETKLTEIKKFGLDTRFAEKFLAQARKVLDAGNLAGATEYLSKATRALERPKDELKTSIETYLKTVETLMLNTQQSLNLDVSDAQAKLADAETALEQEAYEKAIDFIRSAEGLIQSYSAEITPSPPPTPTPPSPPSPSPPPPPSSPSTTTIIAEEEEKPTATAVVAESPTEGDLKTAIRMIVEARTKIGELRRYGFDITTFDGLITLAQEALESNRPAQAVKFASECLEKLAHWKDEAEAQREIEEFENKLKDARERGLEIDEYEQVYYQAKLALQEHRFEDVKNMVTETITKLDEQIQSLAIQPTTVVTAVEDVEPPESAEEIEIIEEVTYDEVIAKLKLARAKINEAKAIGSDVSEAEQILQQARPEIDSENYPEALKYGMQAIKMAEAAIKSIEPQTLIENCKKKIEELKELGANPTNIEKLCGYAESAIDSDDLDLAREYVSQALVECDMVKKQHSEAIVLVNTIKNKLSEASAQNKAVAKAESIFEEMIHAINSGDYELAMNYGREILEAINKAEVKAEITQAEVLDAARSAWAKIRDAKESGIVTTDAEQLLMQGRYLIRQGDYSHALTYINKSIENLNTVKKLYEELVDSISDMQLKITKAKSEGIDTQELEYMYKEITNAMDKGEYETAKSHVDMIINKLNTMMVKERKRAPVIYEPQQEEEQVATAPSSSITTTTTTTTYDKLAPEYYMEQSSGSVSSTTVMPPPPPPEPTPPSPSPPAEPSTGVIYVACYNCGGTIEVTSSERPLILRCPHCGVHSQLD